MTTDAMDLSVGDFVSALGPTLVRVAHGTAVDARVHRLVILDEDDAPTRETGTVYLGIGATPSAVDRLVTSVMLGNSAGIVIREATLARYTEERGAMPPPGVTVLALADDVDWVEFTALGQRLLEGAARGDAGMPTQSLFELADRLAKQTAAHVIIEDREFQIMAYSRATGSMDRARREAILRGGMATAMRTVFEEQGVLRALRTQPSVVKVPPNPASGMGARLAVGIFTAGEFLGSIWVTEGPVPLPPHTERAMQAIAQHAAGIVVRQRLAASVSDARDEVLARRLVSGGPTAGDSASALGIDPRHGIVVIALSSRVALSEPGHLSRLRRIAEARIRARGWTAASFDEADGLWLVYASALDGAAWEAEHAHVLGEVLGDARAAGLDLVALSSDRLAVGDLDALARDLRVGLEAIAGDPRDSVRLSDLWADLALADTDAALGPALRRWRPRIDVLRRYDATRQGDLVETLGVYLATFGDIPETARRLIVHKNTLRYRLRRIEELASLDLSDPDQQLALLLILRSAGDEGS